MMHLNDSYIQQFDAVVQEARDGRLIVLSNTCFYPLGGGQPSDTGVLRHMTDGKEYKVALVRKADGVVLHEVDAPGLKAGDAIKGIIDWPRRHKLMRSHTAAHIVSEVIHRKTGALITGNQLELDKVRIDFSLDAFDPAAFAGYIEEANAVIASGLPVETRLVPRAQAMAIPQVSKLAAGLPEQIKDVRIVEIKGFDLQACGGTHVRNTSEIGRLALLKCENKGAKNRRVYFEVRDA